MLIPCKTRATLVPLLFEHASGFGLIRSMNRIGMHRKQIEVSDRCTKAPAICAKSIRKSDSRNEIVVAIVLQLIEVTENHDQKYASLMCC